MRGLQGIVVLGAPFTPGDDDEPPWRIPLKRLVTLAIARGVPFLALGGGAHLAAVALGGVAATDTSVRLDGLWPVRLTAEGRSDPLFRHLPDETVWVQGGATLFAELPVGAVVLADDDRGLVQAVRFGPRAWGLHGHPEADTAIVRLWLGAGECSLTTSGHPPAEETLARFAAIEPDLQHCWAPVVGAFLALDHGAPSAGASHESPDVRGR